MNGSARPEFGQRIQVSDAEASRFLSRLHRAPLNEGDLFCVSGQPKHGDWNDLPLMPVPRAGDDIGFSFAELAKEIEDVPPWMPPGTPGINLDVYTSVCEFPQGAQRRDADDAVSIPGVWADFDVKPGRAELPHTREELDAVLSALPPVSMLVDSGSGGVHGYWLFTERQPVTDETRDLPGQWIRHVSDIASRTLGRRIDFDSVGDLARVMRLPGSVNQKVRRPVRLVTADGPEYQADEFASCLPAKRGERATEQPPNRLPINGQHRAYAESACRNVLDDLRSIAGEVDGRGNNRIFSATKRLREFVSWDMWTEQDVRNWVMEAVRMWAVPDPNAARTIESAMRGPVTPAVLPVEPLPVNISDRLMDAGDFVFDEPDDVPAVWGEGEDVLWAEGEGFMVAGHQGTGKSTLVQQLVLHRAGLRAGGLLGFSVPVDDRPTLYLAMDRPRQIARSMRRMVRREDRQQFNERVKVWKGPLPFSVLTSPQALADWVQSVCPGCGLLVADSVKDFAPGISKDDVGAALNSAWQEVIARGIELALVHHERKADQKGGRAHSLDDIYGSTWLTSGLGSVFVLDGNPGDAVQELRHLKQPAACVGPLTVRHDHETGTTTPDGGSRTALDALKSLRAYDAASAASARDVAREMFNADGRNETVKAGRALGKLTDQRLTVTVPGTRGGPNGSLPDRWYLTEKAVFGTGGKAE